MLSFLRWDKEASAELISLFNEHNHSASMGALDIEKVRKLIAARANVNAKDENGSPFLHSAIKADREDLAEVLINAGADLEAFDAQGLTPFHRAIIKDQLNLIKIMILAGEKSGKNLFFSRVLGLEVKDQNSESYRTPLHLMVSICTNLARKSNVAAEKINRAQDIAAELIIAGANPNATDFQSKSVWELFLDETNTIHCKSVLFLLLQRSLDIGKNLPPAVIGAKLLNAASASQDLFLIRALMRAGVSVKDEHPDVPSPIMYALEHKLGDALNVMLEVATDADVEYALNYTESGKKIKDKLQNYARYSLYKRYELYCEIVGDDRQIIKIYSKLGMAKYSRAIDDNGDSLLHRAARHHRLNLFSYLLAEDLDVYAKNLKGETPLGLAAAHEDMLLEFLKHEERKAASEGKAVEGAEYIYEVYNFYFLARLEKSFSNRLLKALLQAFIKSGRKVSTFVLEGIVENAMWQDSIFLAECAIEAGLKVNTLFRNHQPAIAFIMDMSNFPGRKEGRAGYFNGAIIDKLLESATDADLEDAFRHDGWKEFENYLKENAGNVFFNLFAQITSSTHGLLRVCSSAGIAILNIRDCKGDTVLHHLIRDLVPYSYYELANEEMPIEVHRNAVLERQHYANAGKRRVPETDLALNPTSEQTLRYLLDLSDGRCLELANKRGVSVRTLVLASASKTLKEIVAEFAPAKRRSYAIIMRATSGVFSYNKRFYVPPVEASSVEASAVSADPSGATAFLFHSPAQASASAEGSSAPQPPVD